MRPWRVASLASGLLAASACGLFPDLSPLTSTTDASTSTDAKSDVAQPVDAKSDAPIVNDAGADTSADVFVSPCAAQHTFCDDFDGPFGAKWDTSEVNSGPLGASTNSVSGDSLKAVAIANGNGDDSALLKHFASATHTHIEFDALVQAPSTTTNDEVDLVGLVLDNAPAPYTFGVLDMMRYEDSSEIEEYCDNPDASTGQDLAFTETFVSWRHVALDIDFGSAQKFTVAIDGTQVQQIDLSPHFDATGYTLYLGVAYTSTNDPWTVFIDNFVLDQN